MKRFMLFSWLGKKKLVGADELGNCYYERGRRRWVIYRGQFEPSKVSSSWHLWLHHSTDDAPTVNARQHSWQKTHLPNMTGTALANHPDGSILGVGKRASSGSDYEGWKPAVDKEAA